MLRNGNKGQICVVKIQMKSIPQDYFRCMYFSIAFLMKLQHFWIKLTYTVLFLILFLGHTCITGTWEFYLLCFPEVVLKNVLSALNELRGDSLNVDNNIFWFAAYKQYVWWVHNYLGKGVRKVITLCVTWTIQKKFPSKDKTYVPYLESKQQEH